MDFGAHIYGLLAGMGIGYAFAPRLSPNPPGFRAQTLAGLASSSALSIAWFLELRSAAGG